MFGRKRKTTTTTPADPFRQFLLAQMQATRGANDSANAYRLMAALAAYDATDDDGAGEQTF